MRFSLILSTQNRVKELEQFLESLVQQTHQDFEVFLIDQNTDDRLLELLDRYGRKLNLDYTKHTEPGLSRARNLGLRKATGDVGCFPDDDCLYPPEFLSNVDRCFGTHPDWDGLIVNVLDLDEDRGAMIDYAKTGGIVDYEKGWQIGMTAALFFRRHLIETVEFDETIGPGTPWGATEDIDYLYSCLDRGAKVYHNPELFVRHPTPHKIYTVSQLIQREYSHGKGAGFLMGKRNFSRSKVLEKTIEPLRYLVPVLLQGQANVAAFLPAITVGRIQGYLGYQKQHQTEDKQATSRG